MQKEWVAVVRAFFLFLAATAPRGGGGDGRDRRDVVSGCQVVGRRPHNKSARAAAKRGVLHGGFGGTALHVAECKRGVGIRYFQ